MAGEVYLSGLTNTGFDYEAYLDKLAQLKSIPLQQMQQKQQQLVAKTTAIVQIKSALNDFLSPLQTLENPDIYNKLSANLSNSSVASVSVDSTKAQTGSYDLEVTQLAKASSFLISPANTISDATTPLSDSGTLTINYKKDGNVTSLAIDYTGKSLADIVNEINSSTDLKATMVNQGTSTAPDYKLLVTSKNTGIDNEITGIGDSDNDDAIGFDTSSTASYTTQQAQNAQIKINGIIFENSTDTFSDALSGVTITANEIGSSMLTINNDFGDIENSLQKVLDTYNKLKDVVNQNTAKGQPLAGEASLKSIVTTIFNKINNALGKYGIIDSPGEGENATGYLQLQKDALQNLLEDPNFDAKTVFSNFADDLDKYVSNYMDNMTLVNNNYLQESNRLQEEIDEKTKRIQKEIENLRIRYAKLDVYLSELNKTRLSIENYAKMLTDNTK